MVWLERMFIVWLEKSRVKGSMFLIRSMKVSITGSFMIGWGMDLVERVCLLERHVLLGL